MSKENKKTVQVKLSAGTPVKRRSRKNEIELMHYIIKKAKENQKNKQ